MISEKDELAEVFRFLGAKEPESWATSQVEEGTPQLHRYVFLKQAWAQVVDELDDSWIDRLIDAARRFPTSPFSSQGHAIERMLASGVERSDVVDLVRCSQGEMISRLCYLLDDPSLDAEVEERIGSVGWALVTTNNDFEATSEVIGGLHESVLDTDPSGLEMRPRR